LELPQSTLKILKDKRYAIFDCEAIGGDDGSSWQWGVWGSGRHGLGIVDLDILVEAKTNGVKCNFGVSSRSASWPLVTTPALHILPGARTNLFTLKNSDTTF
jgi:hypothetical protein